MSAADASRPVSSTSPDYARGLRERVLLVPCPRCGAAQYERCVGQYGRRTKGWHYARSEDAQKAGVVMARGVDLSHVRQVHHELLAVLDLARAR